ncbi:nucleotidyl transferase AbiEii/AbiGii toxin family protein [Candidatus Bipolaricaulota bacterium]|nr:nucleotidyl transferase AbiEii/AbiGii toxin family protein [Candidatus Bipolaricaulota bacterium]
MIREAEVRRLAGQWGVDPMLVDLDYVLGCFLASLYREEWAKALLFKGGTCLRKCYYADYRFSEDLDFTATRRLRAQALEEQVTEVVRAAEEAWQIDFSVRPFRVETIEDEYGKETYQVRIYYRGPLRRAGDPRAIRVDVTLNEKVVFQPSRRAIIHPYSDADLLSDVRVPCYDLLEVLAEKIRALAGQRRYAIARDLYDVAQLIERWTVDINSLVEVLPVKLAAKGLPPDSLNIQRLESRREEFRTDWQRNLVHLVSLTVDVDFDSGWNKALEFLAWVAQRMSQKSGTV